MRSTPSWKLNRILQLLFWISISFLLTGCPSPQLFDQTTVDHSEDIGSVGITMLPPAPFDEYREIIWPNFNLSADDALKEVVPTSMRNYSYEGRSTGTSLSASLPIKSFDEVQTTTIKDGATNIEREDKYYEKSGEIPKLVDNKGTLTKPEFPIKNDKLDIDPLLKYWTATALYQEVQLISNFYKRLNFDDNYVPYIVRCQIGAQTKVRNAPYDTFVDVFFDISNSNILPNVLDRHPVVFPMLVTDSLEAQMSQLSVEQVRELALALKGMVKGAGLGASFDDMKQLLKAAFGRDYNSLLSVGRIGDSTLRVRLGAIQQAGSAFSIISRNHTVSLVVLVPKDYFESTSDKVFLEATSYTQFFDVRSGKQLQSKYYPVESQEVATNNRDQDVTNILKNEFEINIDRSGTHYKDLLKYSVIDDLQGLVSFLRGLRDSGQNGNGNGQASREQQPGVEDENPAPKGEEALAGAQQGDLLNGQVIAGKVKKNGVRKNGFGEETMMNPPIISDDIPALQNPPDEVNVDAQDKLVKQRFERLQAAQVMVRLKSFFSESGYDFSRRSLPKPTYDPLLIGIKDANGNCCNDNVWVCESEALSLHDDGKKSTVSILPIGNVRSTRIAAQVFAKKGDKIIQFSGNKFTANNNSGELVVEFDSLKDWKIDDLAELDLIDLSNNNSRYMFKELVYVDQKPAPTTKLKLINKNGNNYIVVASGSTDSKVAIEINGKINSENIEHLIVEGANLIETDPSDVFSEKTHEKMKIPYVVEKVGKVELKLGNLPDGNKVRIYIQGNDGAKSNYLEYEIRHQK